MSMMPNFFDTAQSTYCVTPSTYVPLGSVHGRDGTADPHDQSLTTQALPGSRVFSKGSGCARISGLQQSIPGLKQSRDGNRLTDRV